MSSGSNVLPVDLLIDEGDDRERQSSRTPSMELVAERIRDISTLPHVAVKVIEIANNPRSGAADLKAVLEEDISLSARVLRTVNSAAYCPRTRITNLLQAISYLGFRQIRNLALTASVKQAFQRQEKAGTYSALGLWRHLVSSAICARMIALRRALPNFEDAYLAGLLHDFGIVLEDQHVGKAFKPMMQGLDTTKTLVENEDLHLGFNHCALGSLVGERWQFPPSVRDTIAFHHMPSRYQGPDATILYCVEIANFICSLKGITSVGANLVRPPFFSARALSLEKEDLKVLGEDLDGEINLRKDLFSL